MAAARQHRPPVRLDRQSGAITPEQFVSLNENVGGYDVIGQVIPQRVTADPIGRRPLSRDGTRTPAASASGSTPIIDFRSYTDFAPPFGGDIHTRFHSFVMRQRLEDARTAPLPTR